MTGRHAAPRDELFDQRERETAGSHRADVEPLGPDDAGTAKAAAPVKKKPATRAKAAPVTKAAKSTPSKKAGTT